MDERNGMAEKMKKKKPFANVVAFCSSINFKRIME